MKIERRYIAPEFRVSQDANEAPVITGYAAVFNVQSADMGWIEEIDPHAFDAVLATNPDVRSLWNHNPDFPLGRTSAGTLSLNLDDKGLSYSVIAPDTSYARDLVVSMRRKDVTQSSFGFICKRDQWTDNADGSVTRRILEFEELIDVSPVTFPAFDAATAGVRSLPDSMPQEYRSRFEKRSDEINMPDSKSIRALTDQCTCTCSQCMAGSCGICSADPQCMGAERNSTRSSDDEWHEVTLIRLRIAESE